MNENQSPDFDIRDSVFEASFDASNFVDFVIDGRREPEFGVVLFLLGKPALRTRSGKVWKQEESEDANKHSSGSFDDVKPAPACNTCRAIKTAEDASS